MGFSSATRSYRRVTESYYSVALQSKYARSDESIKVLDDMRESVYMDFGYNYTGIGASYVVRDIISGKRENLASWYAAMQDMMDNALETELTVYLECFNIVYFYSTPDISLACIFIITSVISLKKTSETAPFLFSRIAISNCNSFQKRNKSK